MAKKTDITADILIIGGGLAGLSLAGVLAAADVKVIILDRAPPDTQTTDKHDGRTTAISYASRHVLQAAGVWPVLEKDACPILDIRVADGASPIFLHFSAEADAGGDAFGWIIENRLLRQGLLENLARFTKNVMHLAPVEIDRFFKEDSAAGVYLKDGRRLAASLLVGADGRMSATRQWCEIETKNWAYDQTAIVCNVVHDLDHEHVAVEHFLPAGPFAVLPMTPDDRGAFRSSVVWTVHGDDAKKMLALSPAAFDQKLEKLFGPHLGKVRHVSKPMSYPLSLMHAEKYVAPRVALMAEAAHVIHPIAGQGLNLSLRDVAVLSELVTDRLSLGLDIGADSLLSDYENWRKWDTKMMAGFTDLLNRLFSNNLSTVALLRDTGLGVIDNIPVLKRFFARQAMGLGGKMPRMISGKRH